MKKIISVLLAIITVLLAISGFIQLVKLLSNFSINSKIELMFVLGFVLYFIVHFLFYKPVFIHVMTHELTHLFWAYLFGGRAKKMEINHNGGKVLINKSNFLISLAPYFFPLYTFFFIIIYLIARVEFLPYIAFFIGASLSFHLALTLYSLRTDQSDFTEDSNIFFSVAFIFLMNVIIIAGVLSLLSSKVDFLKFLTGTLKGSIGIITGTVSFINQALK
ncbi:MAG: hypothetical protein KA120_01195 [Candidatus Goldbacteria bacterium]|nr:hypothetical protein [Candidatus Goldiibacteriota bacterium]